MHFEVEHEFAAEPSRVADVLCDPEFHRGLDLPDLSRPEVLEHTVDGPRRVLRLRYEYVGQLDPIGRTVLGHRRLTWVQELRLDTGTFRGTLGFAADADEKRMHGEAGVAIVAGATSGTSRRRIAGDFHVRVPVVGGRAERAIVPGLVRRLDVEAAALASELTSRG